MLLALPSLRSEIQASIAQKMMRGLLHVFSPFTKYDWLMAGQRG